MVDLHVHSTASDGSLSPSDVVDLAARGGLRAIALTDHDTTTGVPEARRAADALGNTVEVIAGVELEADFDLGALHILGLGIDDLAGLENELEEIRAERTRRNLAMLSRLGQLGIEASYTELVSYADGGVIGRPHLAQLLVDRHVVSTYQEAFDRYLADGAAAHEPRTPPSIGRCIELIHEAGGKAIVAHPSTLWLSSWTKVEGAFERWKRKGLDGVEAYHAGAERRYCRRYAAIAEGLDLLVTAGSDFHGRGGRLGRTCNDTTEIQDEVATPFRAAARTAGRQDGPQPLAAGEESNSEGS